MHSFRFCESEAKYQKNVSNLLDNFAAEKGFSLSDYFGEKYEPCLQFIRQGSNQNGQRNDNVLWKPND